MEIDTYFILLIMGIRNKKHLWNYGFDPIYNECLRDGHRSKKSVQVRSDQINPSKNRLTSDQINPSENRLRSDQINPSENRLRSDQIRLNYLKIGSDQIRSWSDLCPSLKFLNANFRQTNRHNYTIKIMAGHWVDIIVAGGKRIRNSITQVSGERK